ncbi:hypothetical protein CP967_08455 [Streptomyces nitrosporeus]|uniref:Uncharacterized protein n=1 Tax=Streptomyces nitrosporeus TaxID=28894 RepID=A0A5J6FAC7_9ACTN|nr:hypothetical protein [Streptomyces nitrosporeus]QEU71995.1 hypothetical protein CP967_08455 [Streptomyces nitrosporeus]
MNTSSQTQPQTLRSQSSPIGLLTQLLATHPELPAVTYHIDSIVPGEVHISVHGGQFGHFEEWRVRLGLEAPAEARTFGASTWVETKGVVQDVPVHLLGHGTAAEVAGYVAERAAVAA